MPLREEFEETGKWLFKWRSYFPLLIILPLLFFVLPQSGYFKRAFGNTAEYFWEGFCLAVSYSGLIIRCIAIGYVPAGTSGRNTKGGQLADTLNSTGIYSILRHPLYLGNFLIFSGMVLLVESVWLFIVSILFFWLYYERIMFAEEEFLRKKFGDIFLRWAEKTPAFIPRFDHFQKPEISFSFKNVLKREYTAFFQIIISFTLIKVLSNFFTEGKLSVDMFWLILLLIGFLIYITLMMLKRKTKLLHVEGR
ncbi:MAG: methyltransferase [bacterium]|nr:methyltransferase [bacterium]